MYEDYESEHLLSKYYKIRRLYVTGRLPRTSR